MLLDTGVSLLLKWLFNVFPAKQRLITISFQLAHLTDTVENQNAIKVNSALNDNGWYRLLVCSNNQSVDYGKGRGCLDLQALRAACAGEGGQGEQNVIWHRLTWSADGQTPPRLSWIGPSNYRPNWRMLGERTSHLLTVLNWPIICELLIPSQVSPSSPLTCSLADRTNTHVSLFLLQVNFICEMPMHVLCWAPFCINQWWWWFFKYACFF